MKWDDAHRGQAWDDLYRVVKWALYAHDDAPHISMLDDDPIQEARWKAEKLFRKIYEETGNPNKALNAAVDDFRTSLTGLLHTAEKARAGYKKALDSIDKTTSDSQWGFKNIKE